MSEFIILSENATKDAGGTMIAKYEVENNHDSANVKFFYYNAQTISSL